MTRDELSDRAIAPYVDAAFPCARCGCEAIRLTYVPVGAPDPITPNPVMPPGSASLVIHGKRLGLTIGAPTRGERLDRLLSGLALADAEAIYRLDPEYMPFWCPGCRAVFCGDEWAMRTIFDDGFFDEIRGTCPDGHDRQMED